MGYFILSLWGLGVLVSSVYSDPMESCQARNVTYNIGDTKQCDKYSECTTSGKMTERLCDDGFVYSLEISACDYPHNVNCEKRPVLQPSQSTDPNCPRSNGFYAFDPEVSCQKFYHCLEGAAYEKTCPEGVIFDPAKGACIHPDQSKRPECAARDVLNFTCPNSLKQFTKLKFGDHDRHSHPTDCRKFFICLKDGKPRLGGCPVGKVFNGKTGFCDAPKRVPLCKDYYGKKSIAKLAIAEASGYEEDRVDFEEDNGADENQDQENAVSSEEDDDQKGKQNKRNKQQQQGASNKKEFNKQTGVKNSKRSVEQEKDQQDEQTENQKEDKEEDKGNNNNNTDDDNKAALTVLETLPARRKRNVEVAENNQDLNNKDDNNSSTAKESNSDSESASSSEENNHED